MLAALLLATIHSVDFRNFTYRVAGQRVRVHDGIAEVMDERDPETIALRVHGVDVAYGDLLGDRGDEAAVTVRYGLGGTGSFSFVNVYALRRGRPVLVARLAGGDRSYGGVRSVNIGNKRLRIVRNHSSSCNICTDAVVESLYRWNGNKFVLVRRSSSPPPPR
jgi:hypothetical protein